MKKGTNMQDEERNSCAGDSPSWTERPTNNSTITLLDVIYSDYTRPRPPPSHLGLPQAMGERATLRWLVYSPAFGNGGGARPAPSFASAPCTLGSAALASFLPQTNPR